MGCLQSSAQENEDECVICCSVSSNVILIPCGHKQICSTCALHLSKRVQSRQLNLRQESNNYFKNITCPICLQGGGLIKIFSNRLPQYECSVCKTITDMNAFILPCYCNSNTCYECCSNFETNQSEVSFYSDISIVCPICRTEGTFISR